MLIEKKLPYDFCDNCKEFILKIDEHFAFSPVVGSTERVITVYCKNSGKCGHLLKNLKMKEGKSHGNQV